MNAPLSFPDQTSYAQPASKFLIIYDDVVTGIRGKQFAHSVAGATGYEGEPAIALWRHELLECVDLAALASRDAKDVDYLILSLRGDCDLSFAAKSWIESQLGTAPTSMCGLIALFDPARSRASHTSAVRQYLRHIATCTGVDFFCACAVLDQEGRMNGRTGRDAATPQLPYMASAA